MGYIKLYGYIYTYIYIYMDYKPLSGMRIQVNQQMRSLVPGPLAIICLKTYKDIVSGIQDPLLSYKDESIIPNMYYPDETCQLRTGLSTLSTWSSARRVQISSRSQ